MCTVPSSRRALPAGQRAIAAFQGCISGGEVNPPPPAACALPCRGRCSRSCTVSHSPMCWDLIPCQLCQLEKVFPCSRSTRRQSWATGREGGKGPFPSVHGGLLQMAIALNPRTWPGLRWAGAGGSLGTIQLWYFQFKRQLVWLGASLYLEVQECPMWLCASPGCLAF